MSALFWPLGRKLMLEEKLKSSKVVIFSQTQCKESMRIKVRDDKL